MDTRNLRTTALLLGGVALLAAACGTGGSASQSGGSAPSTAGAAAVVSTASVGGTNDLVSADGHTLYRADAETAGHVLCVATCTSFWKPVAATPQQAAQAASALGGGFTAVTRPDGGSQLAYAGHPLYTFTQEGAHQRTGDGVTDHFGGTRLTWSVVTTGGAAAPSSPAGGSSSGSSSGRGGGGYGY